MAPNSTPPPTFFGRIVFHLTSDDVFRTAIFAFIASFTVIAAVASVTGSFLVGLLASVIVLLVAYAVGESCEFINNQILMPAAFLGCAVAVNLVYTVAHEGELWEYFSRYFLFLSVFHFSEFVFTALTNRRTLGPDSFLLKHSFGYWLAASIGWIEFLIEANFYPEIKMYSVLWIGTFGCIIGEIVRKVGMVHAGLAFTHLMARTKRSGHTLINTGIYAYMRHPGYFGWFIWAVSTQIVLCNPISFVIYTFVTWRFFANRIEIEEKDLISFFGDDYAEYQRKTWSGVPFARGYQKP
ncbi:Protein-S-isoprenylcysteine O-methyltransferase [Caenorhabditis elegans]|uniref:Protein-S-isoprenylcysteine O-methyltransferase n=1 Tax=Caenorhabditis elegans TaxID=6239 RepID=P91266_CAEEL|nr:Protein-S-isoprenylcysteine O-methyltransferase [Caenorhabditis elegans]CCD69818.1 Protein-S-isoprenylcysteine O-methyltransferase [Caenorhabditis elegans]|eukprot:NP_491473.1 Protein-S-isoprenylcysteine O-methyltransferase [Caenorhabditis elegans]